VKGKSVILAGGSGGLGTALAEAIVARGGIPVIGCLRNRERALELGARLNAPVVVGDVLDANVRQSFIDAAWCHCWAIRREFRSRRLPRAIF
jgi:NAD(P)-dependent dehydrogenase (short-subunit alcohol dehydrogenase family)